MATTDARTGFRLPWSSEQRATDDPGGGQPDDATTGDAEHAARSTEGEAMIDAADAATPQTAAQAEPAADSSDAPASSTRAKRPSKFLADLTRAMQAAAEGAREEALSRLQADAKAHVEQIHGRSATEAADLRRRADDDVAAIREWSKAEIARIREETETRISDRKGRLESEIEEHAALIERQIERVQSRVASFEQEMAAFFERLLGEDDPTRFAALAGNLPEPPPFDTDDVAAAAAAAMVASPDEAVASEPEAEGWAAGSIVESETSPEDPEAAMAAIQAAAEAAAAAEQAEAEPATAADAGDDSRGEAEAVVADAEVESAEAGAGAGDADADAGDGDPRLSVLAQSMDLAAAEAEAFAAADSTATEDLEIPTIADDALAARLAGLVPTGDEASGPQAQSTQVVVTGLVSVASIASFKRHLGRLPGVQSVGVSSGPDGEFVFAVTHAEEVNLRDAVPTLPGFGARITGGSDGQIDVTAKDPENEA